MRARGAGRRAGVGLVLLALLAFAAPAHAHVTTFEKPTSLTIHWGAGFSFHGKLTASQECLRGRTIEVYWLLESDFAPDGGVIGQTTTHANGRWRVADPKDPPYYKFFATVEREVTRKPGHVHRCEGRASKVLEP